MPQHPASFRAEAAQSFRMIGRFEAALVAACGNLRIARETLSEAPQPSDEYSVVYGVALSEIVESVEALKTHCVRLRASHRH